MAWTADCLYVDPTGAKVATIKGFECLFRNLIKFASELAVIVVFVMFIASGIQYLLSDGDPKAAESAQKTLTYALLGLLFLIGAWLILKFIEVFTGVTVTQFKIKIP